MRQTIFCNRDPAANIQFAMTELSSPPGGVSNMGEARSGQRLSPIAELEELFPPRLIWLLRQLPDGRWAFARSIAT